MHTVVVLALDGTVVFDLGTPLEVFGRAQLPDDRPAYRVLVCAPGRRFESDSMTTTTAHGLEVLAGADTIMIPGVADPTAEVATDVLDAIRDAAASGTRIASICVGAFTLAATGLLDGLRATTHWRAAAMLAAGYPLIDVDPAVLFVDNGTILTSAGAAAGIDLCLHMIRSDYGAAVAANAARISVVPLQRDGGQAQFITHDARAVHSTPLAAVLAWMEDNAHDQLTLEQIAARAHTSTRTVNRRFRDETGMTPVQWLRRARVRRAQALLETTDHSIDRITHQVGFTSATNFRDTFKDTVGTTPASYRRSFRASAHAVTGVRARR